MEILINVVGQKLKAATNQKTLVAGTQEFINFVFELPDDWNGLKTFVQFRQGEKVYEKYLDESNSAFMPPEITEGICILALQGNLGDVIAKSAALSFFVDKDPIKDGATGTEITLTLYDQLVNEVHEIGKLVGYGTGNEFYGDAESQKDSNKLGTRGYKILSYTGAHGESGTYTLDGDEAEYDKLKAVFDAETDLKITVMNDMNWDSGSTITDVSFTDGKIILSVENIYTNSDKTPFDSSVTYNEQGTVWTSAPELGWTIKKRDGSDADASDWSDQACLFVGGHPELGTFAWYGSQTSFGNGNINQGYASFSNGIQNQSRGKYSSTIGRGNKAGYDTHVFGRNNDAAFAQECFVSGFGNELTDNAWGTAALGYKLFGKEFYQFLTGKFNKNKNTNLVEVGNGSSEDTRKNVFEVDRTGMITSKEEYLPFQKMYVGSYEFSDDQTKNLITDATTQVYTRSVNREGVGYGPYVAVKSDSVGMVNGGWYIMIVGFTNIGTWNVQFKGYASGGSKPERNVLFLTEEMSIPSGKHYFICPIYCDTSTDKMFGFYCERNERNITLDSFALYKAVSLPIPNNLKEHETADIISLDSTSNSLTASLNEVQTIYGNLVDDISVTTHHTIWEKMTKRLLIFPTVAGKHRASSRVFTSNETVRKIYAEINKKVGLSHTHDDAQSVESTLDLSTYGGVLQTDGDNKDFYKFDILASSFDESVSSYHTVFSNSELPISAKIQYISSDEGTGDCIVVNGVEYRHNPEISTVPIVIYETITEPIKIYSESGYAYVKITKYTGKSGMLTAMEKAEIADTSAKVCELEQSGVRAHTHELAGTSEETVDLTTVTDSSQAISPQVTSSTLGASGGPFKITLDNTKKYHIKGVFETYPTSAYIQIDGNYLIQEDGDSSSPVTKEFEYTGYIRTIDIYSSSGFTCTFEKFTAIAEHDGFISSSDKAKLDGLPSEVYGKDEVYSKTQTDEKLNLLSLKGQRSGEAIRISDAFEDEQTADVSIRGKNLIPYPYANTTKTINGVTFTVNSDGTITVNGTASADTTFIIASSSTKLSFGSGSYVFSGCPSGGSVGTYYINCAAASAESGSHDLIDTNEYGNGASFSAPNGIKRVYIAIRIKPNTVCENLVFKPMLELGSTATAYTPYVSDLSAVKLRKYGKNLISYPYLSTTQTTNGVTFTDNGDGSITLNGTATARAVFYLDDNMKLSAGKYFLSGNPTVRNDVALSIGAMSINNETTLLYVRDEGKGGAFDISKIADLEKYKKCSTAIRISSGATVNNLVFKPMLELGDAATEYEPYKAPETYTSDGGGNVKGVSVDENTATLIPDTKGVIIDVKYKRDITKAFEELETKLTNALLSTGGNV